MAAQQPQFQIPPIIGAGIIGAAGGLGATSSFSPGSVTAGAGAGTDVVQTANNAFNLSGWFVRIGEILAGLVLLGIGLNAMLKGRPLQVVTSTAGLAAKVVPK